jgi:hypothetical protein
MPTRSLILLTLSLLAAAALLAGCNIIAAGAVLVHGPERIPREYELDSEKTAVVFVDDRENRLPRRVLRQVIGETTTKTLLDEDVVKTMIDSRSAIAATAGERAGEPISIIEVGRRAKSPDGSIAAQTLIYISIDRFTLSPDGQTYAPEAIVYVKVMDVDSEKRLWPTEDKEGYRLEVRPSKPPKNLPRTGSEKTQAETAFAQIVGRATAQLFYRTTVDNTDRKISKP